MLICLLNQVLTQGEILSQLEKFRKIIKSEMQSRCNIIDKKFWLFYHFNNHRFMNNIRKYFVLLRAYMFCKYNTASKLIIGTGCKL